MEPRHSAPSRPIVIGRLVLLAAAAAAVAASFALTLKQDRVAAAGSPAAERYVCPMHPEVTAAAAGECPICRMALEAVGAAKPGAAPAVTDVARQRVFNKPARAPAWVRPDLGIEAVFDKADLVGLAPGDRALFFRAAAPAIGVEVHPTAEPAVAWDATTAKAGFRVGLGGAAVAPGETGWVTLAPKSRVLLVVPSSAVLESPQGPYLLAASTEAGTFTRRPVEIGKVLYGVAVVLSGLREGERVVVTDARFWDPQQGTP